jgi:GDPmannose 4,6-dehydratase
MTKTALVTGATGQDGIYLCRLLRDEGVRVIGTTNPGAPASDRISAYLDGVQIAPLDIRDTAAMRTLIADTVPDEIFHLAAFTSVGQSWNAAEEALAVNHQAVVDLLESVMAEAPKAHVFQASSAELIGDAASSPYARGKQAAALAVLEARGRGLHASTGILFNHESPLRSDAFVTRKITRSAAAVALGKADHVDLGNLEVVRDWGFAGDFVEAMRAMVLLDEPQDLQIGTGVAHSLQDLLTTAFEAAGLSDPMSYVRQDPALLRPADTSFSGADVEPAAAAIGWRARTSFEVTVGRMVEVDLERWRTGVEEAAAYLDVTRAPSGR